MSYLADRIDLLTKYKEFTQNKIKSEEGSATSDNVANLYITLNKIEKELAEAYKLQWEEDHERVNIDDDR